MTDVETQQGTTDYELYQDLTIVENEIKRFIASLHKFFYDLVDCDFERAAEELHAIDMKILKILDEIDQRQFFLLMMEPASYQDENTDDFMRALDFSSQVDSSESKRHNTTSRVGGRTFDASPQPNKTFNASPQPNRTIDASARSVKGATNKSGRNNQTFDVSPQPNKAIIASPQKNKTLNASPQRNKTFNASPQPNKTIHASSRSIKGAADKRPRNKTLDISNSKDLLYTFGVVGADVENADAEFERINNQGTNLYRSKNYENLHGLFDFE